MSADSFEASELQTEEVDDEDGDKGYGDADDQDMEGEDDNAFRLRPQVIGSKPSAQPASTQLRPTVQQPLKHQHQILVKPEAVSAQIEISQPAEQQLVNPFGNN